MRHRRRRSINVCKGGKLWRFSERCRLTAVYYISSNRVEGGLMGYGPERSDAFHRTADYVDPRAAQAPATPICRSKHGKI